MHGETAKAVRHELLSAHSEHLFMKIVETRLQKQCSRHGSAVRNKVVEHLASRFVQRNGRLFEKKLDLFAHHSEKRVPITVLKIKIILVNLHSRDFDFGGLDLFFDSVVTRSCSLAAHIATAPSAYACSVQFLVRLRTKLNYREKYGIFVWKLLKKS